MDLKLDLGQTTSPQVVRQYARPVGEHVSLGKPLRAILFLVPVLLGVLVLFVLLDLRTAGAAISLGVFAIVVGVGASGVRVAAEWERGVLLRLGRFNCVKRPGVLYVIPFIDYVRFVDVRVLALNIPRQKVITKDNVPAEIDGALFFRVTDAEKAIVIVQDFRYAIAQYAQAALRDVVGQLTLDELLAERERIQEQIGRAVEEHVKDWGVHIDSIRLLDIEMPEDLKRMMSQQASAEREKRANITKAEGDKLAAVNLSEAAEIMQKNPGAMQLRTLQSIDGLGPTPSNTIVLFPVELAQAFLDAARKYAKQ